MSTFSTSDFVLASTLAALGFKLDYIDRTQPRVEFNFQRTEPLDQTVQAFWQNDLRVEPKVFCLNQKILKSRLYGEK